MRKTIKPLVALLAIAFMMQDGAFLSKAADDGSEVSIAGVLKVVKKKTGNKTQVMPYIQNGETKTFIKLEFTNKAQRPNLKQYLKKRIVIKGVGKEKVIKEKNYLILTKVDSIEEVASSKEVEDGGEAETEKEIDNDDLK